MSMDLNRRHPDYDRLVMRWVMESDFFSGGVDVLQPSTYSQTINWTQTASQSTGIDARPERPASDFEWFSASQRTYLHKHYRESLIAWQERQARAYHIPLFKPTVNIISSAVLKNAPQRKADTAWDSYLADVDFKGTNIDRFSRQTLSSGVTLGLYHSITDQSATAMPPRTRADAAGLRPYSYLVSPLDLVNWSFDEDGRLRWIQIREDIPDSRMPGDKFPDALNQYRIWTPDEWILYRPGKITGGEQQWVVVASGPHPCSEVPLATFFAQRGIGFAIESPLSDAVDADRAVFNKLSLLDELLFKQAFAIFAVGRREGAPIPDVIVGPGLGYVYDAEGGPPLYVSPDAAQVIALWGIICDTINMIRSSLATSRGQAEQSKEARSAAAYTAEQGDRNNMMVALAESLEAFERRQFDMASRWMDGNPAPPEISYSRQFDLRGINQQIADMVQLKQLEVGSRVMSLLTKPVVAHMLSENGVSQAEIEDATSALAEDMQAAEQKTEQREERQEATPSAFQQALNRADK